MPSRSHRVRVTMIAAAVLAGVAVLGLTGYLAWHPGANLQPRAGAGVNSVMPTFVPSCSWPLQVSGTASPNQTGLMRCYLRALAQGSAAEMLAVAYRVYPGGAHVSRAAFAHAADARSGVATIRLKPESSADPAYFPVVITFADGARESLFIALPTRHRSIPGAWS